MINEGFTGKVGCLTPLYTEDNLPRYDKVLLFNAPLFEYTMVTPNLTFTNKRGVQYQPDRHFNTDGGSIPPIVQSSFILHLNPFDFLRSYLYHDCGFIYGGLYIKYPGEEEFKFRLLDRRQVNALLAVMMPFDGALISDVIAIYTAVNIGSIFVWDHEVKPLKQREERRKNGINVYDKEGNLIEQNC